MYIMQVMGRERETRDLTRTRFIERVASPNFTSSSRKSDKSAASMRDGQFIRGQKLLSNELLVRELIGPDGLRSTTCIITRRAHNKSRPRAGTRD